MNSMTGYGRAQGQAGQLNITAEINSVNRKTLEVSISLPREWQSFERKFQELLFKNLNRGKIQLYIKVESTQENQNLNIDIGFTQNYFNELKKLSEALHIPFVPDADFLLRLCLAANKNQILPESEEILKPLASIVEKALQELKNMRAIEGLALAQDIAKRLNLIKSWISEVESLSNLTVPNYREQLMKRLRQAKLEIDLNDERVLKEIALFADRCDVSEELTRLKSHFEQFAIIISTPQTDSIGRKLDFLCQEIFRELNTLGCKAGSVEITRYILDSKNELERIREQVQNIE